MALTRDQILAADDLKRELVPVPEWGSDAAVYVRMLTSAERDAYQLSFRSDDEDSGPDVANFRARFLTFCIVDEAGNRLFQLEDAEKLGAKSADAIRRIFEAAQRLNGMNAGAIEDARKN